MPDHDPPAFDEETAGPELDKPPAHMEPPREGHPPGLWVLFITEMWERFSYYGMRALFVLFLIASTNTFVQRQVSLEEGETARGEVIEVIAEHVGVDSLSPDAPLQGALVLDEASKAQLASKLSDRFDADFEPVGDTSGLATVGDLADASLDVENWNPGFGWTSADAYVLYGVYTFMVYFTSIFGGIAADRFLGTHRSMLLGGWLIALGHICLAGMVIFSHQANLPVSLSNGAGQLAAFLVGCTFIIIGTGFFKPCVSVMVGQMYRENDPRRDSGFTIFYMGINLGAFLAPIVAASLARGIGWHWGFGAAAVGMLLGLVFYQIFRNRYLEGIGDPPGHPVTPMVMLTIATLIAIPVVPLLLFFAGGLDPIVSVWSSFTGFLGVYGMAALITSIVVIGSLVFLAAQKVEERSRLAVILILAFIGNIFFWTAFEQAGSSLNVFAERNTDRTLFGMLSAPGFPAEFYQSVNPLTILLFAPVFSWLWIFLDRKKLNPSTPMKFAIGLWLLGLAFLAMVFGALEARNGGLSGPQWLLIVYVVITWGELCLSPVGLSMVTKLAPARLQSLMMGLWFFTFALSNLLAGLVARFSTKFIPGEDGAPAEATFLIPGLPGFFLMLVIFPIGAGVLIFVISPWIRKLMRGIK